MVKFKSRYLLIETTFEDGKQLKNIEISQMLQFLRKQVQLNFGDVGLGKINKNLQVKYLNNYTNMLIIRVSRDFIKLIWTTLVLTNNYEGDNVRFKVIDVTGTIKCCETYAKDLLQTWMVKYEKMNKEKEESIKNLSLNKID